MRIQGSVVGSLVVGLLFLWVLGIFWLPERFWLGPFIGDDAVSVLPPEAEGADSVLWSVPGRRGERPGSRRLTELSLEPGRAMLLRLQTGANKGLGLQILDRLSGGVAERIRLRPSTESIEYRVVLDSKSRPGEIGLILWNRAQQAVPIESAVVVSLGSGYRWGPRLFKLVGPLIVAIWAWFERRAIGEILRTGSSPSERTGHPARDRVAAGLVFVSCFLVFRVAPVHQLLDAKYMSVVSHAVLTSGSTALPEAFIAKRRVNQSYTLRRAGDEVRHSFSSAPGILGAPFVAGFSWAGLSPIGPEGQYLGHNELRILRFTAAFLAAATCAMLFLIARLWLNPGTAIALTTVFAFGSQLLSVVSRPFWSHSWAILLLTVALYLVLDPGSRRRASSHVLAATLLSWAYFCRPSMSLAIVGVTLYLGFDRSRKLVPYLATGAAWAALLIAYSQRVYGSMLPPYLLGSHLASGRLASELLVTSYPEAVVGTLLSPGRGLFIYVPFLVVLLLIVVRYWQWLPDRRLASTALGVCIAHWQLVSLFRNWWGGQSFGPRLMSDLTPWWFVLAVLATVAVREAVQRGERRWGRAMTALVLVTVSLAVFIHTRGAWVQETQRGAGIWNWRYPQFLAGILERPEGRENRNLR